MAFTSTGRLVSAGRDEFLVLWDTETGEEISRVAHEGKCLALACPPRGPLVYAGLDSGTVECWNLTTGTLTARLTGHQGSVGGLAVSPDGKTVVTGSTDTSLLVWRSLGR